MGSQDFLLVCKQKSEKTGLWYQDTHNTNHQEKTLCALA